MILRSPRPLHTSANITQPGGDIAGALACALFGMLAWFEQHRAKAVQTCWPLHTMCRPGDYKDSYVYGQYSTGRPVQATGRPVNQSREMPDLQQKPDISLF